MKSLVALITLALLSPCAQAQTYSFTTQVAVAAPDNGGVRVDLANSRTVFCHPFELLASLCAELLAGDIVTFTGGFAPDDSDLGSLGWLPVSRLTLGVPPASIAAPDGAWRFRGCVASISPHGAGHDLVIERGQITETAHCGGGALGRLCGTLKAGDCAFFAGSFPLLGDHLTLESLTVRRSGPRFKGFAPE